MTETGQRHEALKRDAGASLREVLAAAVAIVWHKWDR